MRHIRSKGYLGENTMRLLKSILLLVLAACLTAGSFYLLDINRKTYEDNPTDTISVTSTLTQRVYALEGAVNENDLDLLSDYETGLDKEIASYLKAHGGGRYTDSSGETHYVSSSSGSGGYSGGGGSYYYDDDVWYDNAGSSGSGGNYYDDGPGYTVDVYVDDTEYNICHDCGYEYIGTGRCPNPDCPTNNRP